MVPAEKNHAKTRLAAVSTMTLLAALLWVAARKGDRSPKRSHRGALAEAFLFLGVIGLFFAILILAGMRRSPVVVDPAYPGFLSGCFAAAINGVWIAFKTRQGDSDQKNWRAASFEPELQD